MQQTNDDERSWREARLRESNKETFHVFLFKKAIALFDVFFCRRHPIRVVPSCSQSDTRPAGILGVSKRFGNLVQVRC